MKKKNKLQKKKLSNNHSIMNNKWKILLVFSILLLFFEIGFAALESSVTIKGSATATTLGDVYIESVNIKEQNNVSEKYLTSFNNMTVETGVIFHDDEYSFITYEIVISNASNEVKRFSNEIFDVETNTKNKINYELSGELISNPYLLPEENKKVYLTYKYREQASPEVYNLKMKFDFENSGNLFATLNTQELDLKNNSMAELSLNVSNNDTIPHKYKLNLDSDRFILTDKNSNQIEELEIGARSSENITIYVKENNNIDFYNEDYYIKLSLNTDDTSLAFGKIHVKVNITNNTDKTPPSIGPVSLDINNEIGSFDVMWTRLDEGGSPIVDYVICLYKKDNELLDTFHTNDELTTYRLHNLSADNYYVIIYGIDEAGNSGEAFIKDATVTTEYARMSEITEIRWERTVETNFNNLTLVGDKTANLGEEYSVIIKATGNIFNNGNNVPETIVVVMNGHTLEKDIDYTWTGNNKTEQGRLTIKNVTGDIEITASAT